MQEVRFCPHCHKLMDQQYPYCPWCGVSLRDTVVNWESMVDKSCAEISLVLKRSKGLKKLNQMEQQLSSIEEDLLLILHQEKK